MGLFGFGGRSKDEVKKPHQTSEIHPPLSLTAQPMGAQVSGGLQIISGQRRIVTTIADFPYREEVLSSANASVTGYIVPAGLQDALMLVRTSPRDACLVYDPNQTAAVKALLVTLRATATSHKLSVAADPILASAEVIRQVRMAADESRSRSREGGTYGQSDGAALFREWVERAVATEGSTDIHIGFQAGGRGEVLMKVDGEFEPIDRESNGIFTDRDIRAAQIAAYGLADHGSNSQAVFSETESRACIIDSKLRIANIRLRFGSQRGVFGPKAVCRILHTDLNSPPFPFMEMGFSMDQIDLLRKAQRIGSGVVLFMGETGSGKTTVGKTFIETHPKNGKSAFYEIADPVEYYMRGVHQVPIQRDLMKIAQPGEIDPYAEAVSSLMRMDPSYISIGEIRDSVTARAMTYVANSGHCAIGTLHTDGLVGTNTRLSDPILGVTRESLTGAKMLGFLCYQSLVPKLCKCAIDFQSAKQWHSDHQQHDESDYLGSLAQTLQKKYNLDTGILKYKNPEGCPICHGRGTKGLTMVAEMMMPDDNWLDISGKGQDRAAMRYWRDTYSNKRMDSPDMRGKTIAEHALYKSITGMIDPRNIEKFGPLELLEVLK